MKRSTAFQRNLLGILAGLVFIWGIARLFGPGEFSWTTALPPFLIGVAFLSNRYFLLHSEGEDERWSRIRERSLSISAMVLMGFLLLLIVFQMVGGMRLGGIETALITLFVLGITNLITMMVLTKRM
ncbi:hypothetical protein [Edaphobacillus lindanitolerans]|uniref:Uncharacterized protein n=1 Tax=Edaphobacillus lindanitolerans TaxID=550447 RepID=A0A1U7PSU6_9BACI|nr:hypothetical protein [Edaphobacillus lindanitolerans]SIT90861.1 hypothetical protein SAMN05428946_2533 [Edaphobacillus lindanitolerans]